jgi:outer membrane lipoprotein-sorting protein
MEFSILDLRFAIFRSKIGNRKSKILCLVFTFLCILSGCAAVRPSTESTTPPDLSSSEVKDTRSILATLKMRYDLVDSMRTWMNVRIESRGQREEIREYLHYQKPDRLRVDAMGPFNEPRVIALAVEKSFRIYFVAENEVIMGNLSDGVIKDIFNVDLRVSDMHSSIFANPFLDGNVDELQVESYGDEYLIRRSSTHVGYHEEISILARDVVVNKWRIMDAEGKVVQEITFSKYRKVGGILRPLKAVIHRPADETRLSIEATNPEINVELAETTFDLPIPEGAKVYQLSDLKEPPTPGSDSDQ